MVLDKLGASLKGTIQKITDAFTLDDKLINEFVKDIQRALLQADVNVKYVFEITKTIKDRIKNEKIPKGLNKKHFLIHILNEELTNALGGDYTPIKTTKKSNIFMLVGLFGNGKTTTAGKLAKYYQKRGKKVALLSTDTWRPAAFEQLQQLGKQINVAVFGKPELKDPVAIFNEFKDKLKEFDIVFVDTAGRDALNDELIEEINSLYKTVSPQEVLLVMNADIGQAAQNQAQTFHDTCHVTGLVITKLDGTAKGGGALTAAKITNSPVKFIGIGEKIDDIEEFKPKNFVGRLLGMGDLEKLLETAKEAIDEEDAADLQKRLLKGEFTLVDLYEQVEAMKKMGPLNKVMDLIPGMSSSQLPKEVLDVQEHKMTAWRHIMDSCTKEELSEPLQISGTRINRIAKGSGHAEREVRELLKHYKQSKKMVKMLKGFNPETMGDEKMSEKQMQRMMKKMGNMRGMKNMLKGMK